MANLILLPSANTYILSSKPGSNFVRSNVLYSGKDISGAIYRTLLFFDLCLLPQDIIIEAAILRIYAYYTAERSETGLFTSYIIASDWDEKEVNWNNQPDINLSIAGKSIEVSSHGWYNMDITSIVQTWMFGKENNNGLMIKSLEDESIDVKNFHSLRSFYYRNYRPLLEIRYNYKNSFSLRSRNTDSIFEVQKTRDLTCFSSWQNTSAYSMYTFFVQNVGNDTASVFVQISPDRNAVYDEAAVYNIAPGDMEAIVPQKYGFYSRLAFKSFFYGRQTTLKIWFQAQV